MSTVELIEQWLEKCDQAHQAQTRYDRDPTPTNYSRLKRAQEERGAVERRMAALNKAKTMNSAVHLGFALSLLLGGTAVAQIIPAQAIASIRNGGDRAVFAKAGYELLDGWSYRGMWWVSHDDHGSFAARGVHGQTIWIDPAADMVIVRFASNPIAGNAANDPTSLPAYRAVADYLMSQESSAGPGVGP